MISGQEQPDEGSIRLGDTVQLAMVDQSRDSLDDDKTVWEEISDGQDLIKVGNYETPSRASTSVASTSAAPSNRKKSACCPAASATACIWRRPCEQAAT